MAKEYQEAKYLSEKDQPTNRVRCPIHGFIRFSDNEKRIIDSKYFRRLRHIRQLGLTEYAYPGANHTRFEHSLGVMEVATAMFDSLARKWGGTMEQELKQIGWFSKDTLAKARQVVRLAALLHDTGHAPFSHAAEKVFHPEGHEALSIQIISSNDYLGSTIDELWGQGTSEKVAHLLLSDQAKSNLAPQLFFLKQIISGEIDADRTDYLLRDSYHCGVEYGRFDHRRLIECLTLCKSAGGLEVAIDRDGIHTVEALIMARFQMNAQVYFHRIRRIYDYFLIQYLKELQNMGKLPSTNPLDLNDVLIMNQMFQDAQSDEDSHLKEYALRIIERKHPRVIYETGDDADVVSWRNANELLKSLEKKYTNVHFILDGEDLITIHKVYVPGNQSGGVEVMVLGKNGEESQLGSESRVISKIPKEFRCVRIFADADAQRKNIEKFVADWSK